MEISWLMKVRKSFTGNLIKDSKTPYIQKFIGSFVPGTLFIHQNAWPETASNFCPNSEEGILVNYEVI